MGTAPYCTLLTDEHIVAKVACCVGCKIHMQSLLQGQGCTVYVDTGKAL